ncbi:hypothetical protein [Panacagrimonas sp.]|uniref:hypothetical protein n=1 Tax=Panacagrimonas sp. TaxID=2480088 RepID=UPI003B52B172
MAELLASLLLTMALAGLGAGLWSLHRRAQRLLAAVRRRRFQAAEARRLSRAQEQLAQAQRLSETAVSGSAHLVRAVHHGIAAIPFGILEAIPVTRDTTRIVHKTHDLIAGAVYDTIQAINRGVGSGLRHGLHHKPQASSPDAHAPASDMRVGRAPGIRPDPPKSPPGLPGPGRR